MVQDIGGQSVALAAEWRQIVAPGVSLGLGPRTGGSPGGAEEGFDDTRDSPRMGRLDPKIPCIAFLPWHSIPHVARVILNAVTFQQFEEFLLEGPLPMVLFLVPDVTHDGVLVGFAH